MRLPRKSGLSATLVAPNNIVFSTSGLIERRKQIFSPRIIIHYLSSYQETNMKLYICSVFIELLKYCPPQDRSHDRRHDVADTLSKRHLFCWLEKKNLEIAASRLKILLPTDVVIWSSFYLFLTGISLDLKKIRSVVVVRRP